MAFSVVVVEFPVVPVVKFEVEKDSGDSCFRVDSGGLRWFRWIVGCSPALILKAVKVVGHGQRVFYSVSEVQTRVLSSVRFFFGMGSFLVWAFVWGSFGWYTSVWALSFWTLTYNKIHMAKKKKKFNGYLFSGSVRNDCKCFHKGIVKCSWVFLCAA